MKSSVQFSMRTMIVFIVAFFGGWQSNELFRKWKSQEPYRNESAIPRGTKILSLKVASAPPDLGVGHEVDVVTEVEATNPILENVYVYDDYHLVRRRNTVSLVVENADIEKLFDVMESGRRLHLRYSRSRHSPQRQGSRSMLNRLEQDNAVQHLEN